MARFVINREPVADLLRATHNYKLWNIDMILKINEVSHPVPRHQVL